MDRQSTVHIMLLGSIHVRVGGQERTLRGRGQRISIARLALAQGRPVPTSSLIEDLWGGNPPRNASHALQAHVHRLRSLLPINIEFSNDGYQLGADMVTIDARQFTDLYKRGRALLVDGSPERALASLDGALRLWRGPALSDVDDVPGIHPFALELSSMRQAAGNDRFEALLQMGEGESLVNELRASLSLDPLQETTWHQLMRALWRAGQEADAIAAYRQARVAFLEALDSEPGTGLQDLHRRIVTGSAGSDPKAVAPGRPIGLSPPNRNEKTHFFGRQAEIAAIGVLWMHSRQGLQIVTLSGEAGVGKTRLAEEVCQHLSGRIITEDEALHSSAVELARQSQRGPLLFRMDNVREADSQKIAILEKLLNSSQRINALVLVCLQDPLPRPAVSTRVAQFLRQSDRVTHMALARLSEDESSEMIDAECRRLGVSLPEWAFDHITHASGGNPLFITELTRQLAIGRISDPDSVPDPPPMVEASVLKWISQLEDETQVLLRLASVVGDQFDLGFVAQLSGSSTSKTATQLEAAVNSGLLTQEPSSPDRYLFAHGIVQTILYKSLSPTERARVHCKAIDVLREEPPAMWDHLRLAHHYRRSGQPAANTSAAKWLFAAAQDSMSRGALPEAEHLLADALKLLAHEPASALLCDVLTLLGTIRGRLTQPEYGNTLLQASEVAIALEDGERLATAVLANNRGWWTSTASLDFDRLANIETALAWCSKESPATRSQLLALWALENVRDRGAREAVLAASEEALEIASQSGDREALAAVLAHRYSVLYALFESPTECLHLNERLRALSSDCADPSMRLSAAVGLTQSNIRLGDFAAADRYLAEATHLAESLDDTNRLWLVRGWNAMRAIQRKNYQLAEELIFETFALGTRTGQADAFTWFVGQLYTLRLLQGRMGELVDQVREQAAAMVEGIPAWRAAMALALALTGEVVEARQVVEELAANDYTDIPRDMLWLNAIGYLALTCRAIRHTDAASDLYRLLLPYRGMIASNGTIGAGPVDMHLGILADLDGRSDSSQEHFRDAAKTCRRISAPAWLDFLGEHQIQT